jgi:hypothetical protein
MNKYSQQYQQNTLRNQFSQKKSENSFPEIIAQDPAHLSSSNPSINEGDIESLSFSDTDHNQN